MDLCVQEPAYAGSFRLEAPSGPHKPHYLFFNVFVIAAHSIARGFKDLSSTADSTSIARLLTRHFPRLRDAGDGCDCGWLVEESATTERQESAG